MANGQEFKKYITELQEQPNICVQENLDFIITGYSSIRKDRAQALPGKNNWEMLRGCPTVGRDHYPICTGLEQGRRKMGYAENIG